MNISKEIGEKHTELFGPNYKVFSAQGRINLIGEHTDYNDGFVLPAAVNKYINATYEKREDRIVKIYSLDFNEYEEFQIGLDYSPKYHWTKYIYGVVDTIVKLGYDIKGFNSVFSGNIPSGAGMSSSAALETVYAQAVNNSNNLGLDKLGLAKIGQIAEHNYVGVKCGIMDQFASCFGKDGCLIFLDCKSLDFKYIEFFPQKHKYKLVLINSNVKHELSSSQYNQRRISCENVVKQIKTLKPEVNSLRDAEISDLELVKDKCLEIDLKRAKYVIEEIERTQEAVECITRNDFEELGNLMYKTHYGLSQLYEVSVEELDFLVSEAKNSGVAGARLMGGGFGGCTINLVKEDYYDQFLNNIKKIYKFRFGKDCDIIEISI